MNDRVLFLDTTVFADRLFGGAKVVKAIKSLVLGRRVKSSIYVREQFRATFLRAAVLVYNALKETRDPYEVIRRTDKFNFFTQGEGVKARKVLVSLMQHEGLELSDRLALLERWIEFDLMRLFETMAKLKDETRCCQCPDMPTRDSNGFYRFKKDCTLAKPRPCAIEGFWQLHLSALDGIAAADSTATLNESIRPAIQAAADVKNGGAPRGKRCFVSLSDASIVAESDSGSTLVTTNLKDFVPLAIVVGGGRDVVGYAESKPAKELP